MSALKTCLTTLPPELLDRALDFLHDDPDALVQCALQTPEIDEHRQLELSTMLEESPHLGPYFRCMTFHNHIHATSADVFEKTPNVTRLTIHCGSVADAEGLCNILNALPKLEYLCLQEVFFLTENLPEYHVLTHNARSISVLDFHWVDFKLEKFMQLAIAADLFPRVHTLSYDENQEREIFDHFIGIAKFLGHYGSNIRTLRIRNIPRNHLDAFIKTILPCLTQLETFRYASGNRDQRTWLTSPNIIPQIFRRITSNDISHISLESTSHRDWSADAQFINAFKAVWEDVERVLNEPRFAGIHKVEMLFRETLGAVNVSELGHCFEPMSTLMQRGTFVFATGNVCLNIPASRPILIYGIEDKLLRGFGP